MNAPHETHTRLTPLIVGLCALALTASPLAADTLYWDTNGDAAGAGNPANGDWDASTANWTDDATGESPTLVYTAGSDVVFSAGSDAAGALVSLFANQTANSLSVVSGNVSLTGGKTLTLSSDKQYALSVAAGASLTTTATTLAPSAGLPSFYVDGTLTAGNLNGGKFVTIDGTGTSSFAYVDGGITLNGGTATVTSTDGKLKNSIVADGALLILAGNFSSAKGTYFTANGTLQVESTNSKASTKGLSGSGVVTGEAGSRLTIGTDKGSSTFSGQFTDAIAITKAETGTFTFNGVGTTKGDYTVAGGNFVQGASSTITFYIGADGVNNQISGDGAAVFNGTFSFNLDEADLSAGNRWLIAGVAEQSFSGSFAVTDFASGGEGLWTSGDGRLVFDQSTGILSAVPEPASFALASGLLILCLGLTRRVSTDKNRG